MVKFCIAILQELTLDKAKTRKINRNHGILLHIEQWILVLTSENIHCYNVRVLSSIKIDFNFNTLASNFAAVDHRHFC